MPEVSKPMTKHPSQRHSHLKGRGGKNASRLTRTGLVVSLIGIVAMAIVIGAMSLSGSGTGVPERATHDPRTRAAGDIYPYGVVVDVMQYGAAGDGVTDDTAAIQAAISDNAGDELARTLFFPDGTYLVSDRLEWRDANGRWSAYLSLQGESREGTAIRLADNAPGFGDPDEPRAVIFTASEALRTKVNAGTLNWTGLGEGNEAFRNSLFDLTIDTGSDNPGAIAIDYLANNVGAIRNVGIVSGDGRGVVGIAMVRQWPGPALIQDVSITGFDYGVHVAYAEYGMTFERLTLTGQHRAGIRNEGNVLSVRALVSDNAVPAIENTAEGGLITLVEAKLRGGASSAVAIDNTAGEIFARDVSSTGYRTVLRDRGNNLGSASIDEYVSSGGGSRRASSARSLGLPVEETPVIPRDDPRTWANVEDFGARGLTDDGREDYEDDAGAIQRAIDSGARTVYLPRGFYKLGDTVYIRAEVQRIVFAWSWMGIAQDNEFGDGRPLFSFEDGSADAVMLDQLGPFSTTTKQATPPTLNHNSRRALIVRDSSVYGYSNAPGSGPLFLENVVGTPWRFQDQGVWARQFNLEGYDQPKIRNEGADLWVLGIKTELPTTVLESTQDGQTEVLGGLLYPVNPVAAKTAAFSIAGGRYSLSYAVTAFESTRNFQTHVQDLRARTPYVLDKSELIERGYGSVVPLFTDEGWSKANLTPR